jgi:hypothetical protein
MHPVANRSLDVATAQHSTAHSTNRGALVDGYDPIRECFILVSRTRCLAQSRYEGDISVALSSPIQQVADRPPRIAAYLTILFELRWIEPASASASSPPHTCISLIAKVPIDSGTNEDLLVSRRQTSREAHARRQPAPPASSCCQPSPFPHSAPPFIPLLCLQACLPKQP